MRPGNLRILIQQSHQALSPLASGRHHPHQGFDHHQLQVQPATRIEALPRVLTRTGFNAVVDDWPAGRCLARQFGTTAKFTVPDSPVMGTDIAQVRQTAEPGAQHRHLHTKVLLDPLCIRWQTQVTQQGGNLFEGQELHGHPDGRLAGGAVILAAVVGEERFHLARAGRLLQLIQQPGMVVAGVENSGVEIAVRAMVLGEGVA